jgi:hypothetical protein
VKQARLKDLRAKNYQGSEDDWANIVSLILGQSSLPSDEPDWATGLETLATISDSEEDKEIVITIRKRVQTITVRVLPLCNTFRLTGSVATSRCACIETRR